MSNPPPPTHQAVPLPPVVEQAIQVICDEQNLLPLGVSARRKLSLLGEEQALSLLKIPRSSKIKNFDMYIIWLVNRRSPARPLETSTFSPSPASSSPHDSAGSSSKGTNFRPYKRGRMLDFSAEGEANCGPTATNAHINALSNLEFKKAFLVLSYIGREKLEEVTSPGEIQSLQRFESFAAFESEIWTKFGQQFCNPKDRLKVQNFEWLEDKRLYYHCHVRPDGSYYFKGPFLNNTTTHLQRSLGDENVLIVKFESDQAQSLQKKSNVPDRTAISKVFQQGIFVARRCFRFFVFKDGGKEEKRKNPSSNPVKCYFVHMESLAGSASVQKARSSFMHVHNISSLSKYMARFSLILSKTLKMDIDLNDVCFQDIEDIPCLTKDGERVLDIDGKPMIQTDGTGFISEDLAMRCPRNCFKGAVKVDQLSEIREQFLDSIRSKSQSEPPLLIQFRMFYKGRAVKGTVLVNKKLPPRTIQVRPSMIKVETDPALLGAPSINSFEIVGTSNKPKMPCRLSKNLIALLNYGGVPEGFFLEILANCLLDAKSARTNRRTALEVVLNHGDNDDDLMLARLIASGISLKESHVQHRLSSLVEDEKKSLKSGRLPIRDSYYVMGSADPTGVLNSNEVCVILETGQVSGKILVYRNPGVHFGDIHIVEAVYVKGIEEVVGRAKYGILFSTKGPRSLGDKIAGGDYDGDMYWVSLNPQLLEFFKPSEPWTCMHTSPTVPSVRPCDLPPEELEEHLIGLFMTARFQPSIATGVAASSWLSFMDRLLTLGDNCSEEKQNVKEKILKLIDIYYDALDAPKTGKKVEVPPELVPAKYPHHMERHEFCTYKSTSILGRIHDTVIEFQEQAPPVQAETTYYLILLNGLTMHLPKHLIKPFMLKLVSKLPYFKTPSEACLQLWEQNYKKYRSEMSNALNLDEDLKKDAAAQIIKTYIRELYGADRLEQSMKSWEEIRHHALAVYHVVYNYAIDCQSPRLCGFAWKIAGSALLKIFLDQQTEKTLSIPPSVLLEMFR